MILEVYLRVIFTSAEEEGEHWSSAAVGHAELSIHAYPTAAVCMSEVSGL